jgi:exodeoxyribonuclease V alpha subunit
MGEMFQGVLPMQMNDALSKQGSKDKFLRGVPLQERKTDTGGTEGDTLAQTGLLSAGQIDLAGRADGAISGVVTKIQYSNPEKEFYVLRVRLEESGTLISFIGNAEPVAIGDRVEAKGSWERHAKYGRQLRARFIRVLVPSTGREIYEFLKSGGIKGVGKRSAEKLYKSFGDDLVRVLEHPTIMMKSGITEAQAEKISDVWSKRTTHTELLAFLQSLNIGPATAGKILKKYGDRAKQVVLQNPFQVVRDISGVGFKTSDYMALAMGMDRRDPRRIDAAIMHCMGQIGRDGHCACPRHRIVKDVRDLLTIQDRDIKDGISRLMGEGLLVEEENGGSSVVYEASVLKCELEIAEKITARVGGVDLPDNVDELIQEAASEIDIASIHEHQALAVYTSLRSLFSVITGGPGSGKTSSLEVLLRVFEKLNPGATIELLAPTGRAAQRMSESTGRPARTIHRGLGYAPEAGGFQRNEDNPIDADMVVVDEASMLDIWLARHVLRALKDGATVVFVGDVDQLPSVGAGRVLGDIIESGVVPVTRLTRIFRQGAGSLISEAAREINSGKMPRLAAPHRDTDMWAIYSNDPEVCLEKVSRLSMDVGVKMGLDPMRDIQILVAGHGGSLGTVAINEMMQERLNPLNPGMYEVPVFEKVLRAGDRVIQMTNNYDLDVFNGDIGQISKIARDGRKGHKFNITVDFEGREVVYNQNDAKELNLAYAISVHKSQGSEFPFVIFVASTQHFMMLKKTLIYTAVTRAKKVCAIVGQDRAVKISVKQTDAGRMTGMAKRLAICAAERSRLFGE